MTWLFGEFDIWVLGLEKWVMIGLPFVGVFILIKLSDVLRKRRDDHYRVNPNKRKPPKGALGCFYIIVVALLLAILTSSLGYGETLHKYGWFGCFGVFAVLIFGLWRIITARAKPEL